LTFDAPILKIDDRHNYRSAVDASCKSEPAAFIREASVAHGCRMVLKTPADEFSIRPASGQSKAPFEPITLHQANSSALRHLEFYRDSAATPAIGPAIEISILIGLSQK
jgi:hypothetical protein